MPAPVPRSPLPQGRRAPPARRRPPPPWLKACLVVLALAVLAAGLYAAGAFNPWLLARAVRADPVLSAAKVTIATPRDGLVEMILTDPERIRDAKQWLHLASEIKSTLTIYDRDTGPAELERRLRTGPIEADIARLEANPTLALLERAAVVAGRYYQVHVTVMAFEGNAYLTPAHRQRYHLQPFELTFAGNMVQTGVEHADWRAGLAALRQQVQERDATRRAAEERDRARLSPPASFADSFDGTLVGHWMFDRGRSALRDGRLVLEAQGDSPYRGSRYGLPEPRGDYDLEVTVLGSPTGEERGGFALYYRAGGEAEPWLAFIKTRVKGVPSVRVQAAKGYGLSAPVGDAVRIRVERRRRLYTFSRWDEARPGWSEVERTDLASRIQRSTADIALVAFGDGDSFSFDDFSLTEIP